MRNGKIVGRARACGFFEAATKQWPRSWTTPSHCWWWSLSESLVKFWRLNDAMAAFPLAIVRLWNHMGLSVESHGFETSSSDIQKTQEPGPVVMFFIYSTMSTCDKKAVVFFDNITMSVNVYCERYETNWMQTPAVFVVFVSLGSIALQKLQTVWRIYWENSWWRSFWRIISATLLVNWYLKNVFVQLSLAYCKIVAIVGCSWGIFICDLL